MEPGEMMPLTLGNDEGSRKVKILSLIVKWKSYT
jgi:hypothetical protein